MGPLRKVQENLYTKPIRTKLFNLKLTKKQTLNQAINKVNLLTPTLTLPRQRGRAIRVALKVGRLKPPLPSRIANKYFYFSCIVFGKEKNYI
jgi:hypothetical protein